MHAKALYAVLIVAVLFSNGLVVRAQGTQSNGEKIRLLKEEIKKRETADAPDELKELNRSKLMERRAELRTLLRAEINNLQKYRAQLQTAQIATPEENQQIDTKIQDYEAQIKGLGESMQKDLAAETQPSSSTTASGQATASNIQPITQPKFSASQFTKTDFVGEPLNLHVINGNIRDILNFITDEYGVKFVLDDSVKAIPVSVKVSNVPWNTALASLLKDQHLGIQVNGETLRVLPLEALPAKDDSAKGVDTQKTVTASTTTNGLTVPTLNPPTQPQVTSPTTTTTSGEPQGGGTATADCKQQSFSQLDKIVCEIARTILKDRKRNRATGIVLNGPNFLYLIDVIIAKRAGKDATTAFLTQAEETRLDKQMGSTPSAGGSTSLVVKGGAPTILGFAVENGGLTQSVDKTAVTFRGNPVGLINALANTGFVTGIKNDERDPVLRFLKKTSFAFTFNTDRGPTPGVFTGTKQQLSSVSARVEFINNRRPELYIKDWEDFLARRAQPIVNSLSNDFDKFIDQSVDIRVFPYGKWIDPAMQAWFTETQKRLVEAPDNKVEAVLNERLNQLPTTELSPKIAKLLGEFENELNSYVEGRRALLDRINHGTVVTFEYLNNREVNAPDTSNFRFIAEKGTGGLSGSKVDLTFNGSLTIFNKKPSLATLLLTNPTATKAGRVRDFQFAGQLDMPLGEVIEGAGKFVLFAGGRYERLMENATDVVGKVMPNTKGDIGIFQFGVKIPIKGSGIKIPLSMTFANRTELIKEKEVRGNFGITLDLDTIFAKFKPF